MGVVSVSILINKVEVCENTWAKIIQHWILVYIIIISQDLLL